MPCALCLYIMEACDAGKATMYAKAALTGSLNFKGSSSSDEQFDGPQIGESRECRVVGYRDCFFARRAVKMKIRKLGSSCSKVFSAS